MLSKPRAAGLALSLLALALAGCAGTATLDSPRRSGEIQVDGSGADWEGRLHFVEELGLSLGAQHDDEALYLAIATSDRALQEAILARGLVLWLDGEGGHERRLGLRYPPGLELPAGGALPSERGRPGRTESALDQRQHLEARLADLPAEFILLRGEEDGGRLLGRDEVPGLAFAMKPEGTRLLYELRIPLGAGGGSPLPLVLTGDALGLGLELAALSRPGRAGEGGPPPREMGGEPDDRGGGPGGMPGGGMGGGPGGMPGGMGHRPGGEAELDAWVRLRLVP